jgi:hypothetical protein
VVEEVVVAEVLVTVDVIVFVVVVLVKVVVLVVDVVVEEVVVVVVEVFVVVVVVPVVSASLLQSMRIVGVERVRLLGAVRLVPAKAAAKLLNMSAPESAITVWLMPPDSARAVTMERS